MLVTMPSVRMVPIMPEAMPYSLHPHAPHDSDGVRSDEDAKARPDQHEIHRDQGQRRYFADCQSYQNQPDANGANPEIGQFDRGNPIGDPPNHEAKRPFA